MSAWVAGPIEKIAIGRRSARESRAGDFWTQTRRIHDHAPVSDGGRLLLHPTSEQVEGEELEQERGLVGVEGFGGDFSDGESALELSDDGLDACAPVVATCEVVGVVGMVVGDVEVRRVVHILPEARLMAASSFA